LGDDGERVVAEAGQDVCGLPHDLAGLRHGPPMAMGYAVILPDMAPSAAVMSAADGDPARAARLLGAADSGYSADNRISDLDDAEERDRLLEALSQAMTRAGFDGAYAAGADDGLRQVLADETESRS
jgi:hypothetical protein